VIVANYMDITLLVTFFYPF